MQHNYPKGGKKKKSDKEVVRGKYEPNVIVTVAEELAEYVDGHNPQTAVCLRFNLQDGKDRFIKNGVSDIFGRISVCCYLSRSRVSQPHE